MVEFRALPMSVHEARSLAAAALHADARSADWCVAQLQDKDNVVWHWLARQLRLAHAVHRDLVPRVRELAAAPKTVLGIRMPVSKTQEILRLRANVALLWLDDDASLDSLVQAIEGKAAYLRTAALHGISTYGEDLRWPDRYYEALFDSCRRIYDSASEDDRLLIVGPMFERQAPALADAMRELLATSRDFRRHRAAIWLLRQGQESDVRSYVDSVVGEPFPAGREQRRGWYAAVDDLMREMKGYVARAPSPASRAWAAATVLALLDRLLDAATVEGEPGIDDRWYPITSALPAIRAEITPEAAPLLARWATAHSLASGYREYALAMFGAYAGEAAAAQAAELLFQDLPRADTRGKGRIARLLMAFAPASGYAGLAPVLRALFDAVPPQQEKSYRNSDEQDALAGLASALVQFDPDAGAHIEARLAELGPVQLREVKWALAGRTVAQIAALLAVGGAIAPMSRLSLLQFTSDGGLVRELLYAQSRLAIFNSRDDNRDPHTTQAVKKFARIAFPQIDLEAVTPAGSRVRFVHGDRVFEIRAGGEGDFLGAAAAFNQFLAHIVHPQRVFAIGEDGGETDNDIAAFFCADPARMPAVAAQLGFPAALAA